MLSSNTNLASAKRIIKTIRMAKGDALQALGRRIAQARKAKGISGADLARALRVSRGAVSQWESGTFAPATENLGAIAVELNVAFEWLATGRGQKDLPEPDREPKRRAPLQVPLLSWVSAGRLIDANSQIPTEDVPLLAFADLGRGEFFALRVQGDSMDRLSPDGSVIVVNRADRELRAGKPYVFWHRSEGQTYKLWEPDPPRLEPASWNPVNKPIFIKRKADFSVIGKVRRTLLDL